MRILCFCPALSAILPGVVAAPPGGAWGVVWSDEFNVTSLDGSKWVQAATLVINGVLFGSAVSVRNGAAAGGIGRITRNVTVNGVGIPATGTQGDYRVLISP